MAHGSQAKRESLSPPSKEEERALARNLRDGDEQALERLLQLHWVALVGYILPMVRDQDQAEDVVQRSFVRLWTRRGEWRSSETLRPVLYRIARNLALNERRGWKTFLRWRAREQRRPLPLARTPAEELEGQYLRELVWTAIDALPDRRREIFLLVRFHCMSFREAGNTLGISSQTVANQMSQANADLRRALGPMLLEEPGTVHLTFPRSAAR